MGTIDNEKENELEQLKQLKKDFEHAIEQLERLQGLRYAASKVVNF